MKFTTFMAHSIQFNHIRLPCIVMCDIIHLSPDSVEIPSARWSKDFKSWSISQSGRQSPQSTHVTTLSHHGYPLYSCSILEIQSTHGLPASIWVLGHHRVSLEKNLQSYTNVIGSQIFQWRRWTHQGLILLVAMQVLYTPHTCWCKSPMNDSYQHGAL